MGIIYNPKIVNRGVVLAVDAANSASINNKIKRNIYNGSELIAGDTDGFGGGSYFDFSRVSTTPDGLNTIYARRANSGVATWSVTATLIERSTYTYSIWVKPVAWTSIAIRRNEPAVYVAQSTNIAVTPGIWQRVSWTFTVSAGKSGSQVVGIGVGDANVGQPNEGIFLYGAQLEPGPLVTEFYTSNATGLNTTVNDLSSNKFIGTLVDNIKYDPTNNGAIVYDNISTHIDLPLLQPQTNQPLSVFAWVNLAATPLGTNGVWGHYGTDSVNCHFEYTATYGRVRLGNVNNSTLPVLTPEVWTYVGFTSSGSNQNYYVNGVLTASWAGTTGTILGGGSPGHFIGRSDAGRSWNGRISHLIVHSVELTASEIQQNFNALRGRYGV